MIHILLGGMLVSLLISIGILNFKGEESLDKTQKRFFKRNGKELKQKKKKSSRS